MGVYGGPQREVSIQSASGRSLYSSGVVQDGLVLNLDAGKFYSYPQSGITWTDLSGGGNIGTLTNGPTYSSANGGSIVFDGSNDYVTSSSTTLNLTAGVSVGVFFKSTDITSRQQGLFSYNIGTLGNPYINFWCPGNGLLRWETFTSTSPNVGGDLFSPTSLANNTWYHCIGTYNNSGVSNLYLNGLLVATSTYSASSYSSYSAPIIIGQYSIFGNLSGNIAQVSIYNRALSAAEVLQNFYALKSRFYPSIVTSGLVLNLDAGDTASYPGSGTTWTDLSGSGNNGTLTNGPTYSSANGGSIVFDGSNDYVDLISTIQFDAGDFSISGWFRSNSGNTSYKQIWSSGYNGGTPDLEIGLLTGTNQLYFYIRPPGVLITTTYTVDDNVWRHFTATKTSSTISLYVNDSLVSSTSGTYTSDVDSAGVIPRIGNGVSGINNRPFNGNIPQVSVYNRALSAAEVSQNFNVLRSRFGI
jgi:hypothetical protein